MSDQRGAVGWGDGVRVQVEDAFGLPWVEYIRAFDWVYPNAEI